LFDNASVEFVVLVQLCYMDMKGLDRLQQLVR